MPIGSRFKTTLSHICSKDLTRRFTFLTKDPAKLLTKNRCECPNIYSKPSLAISAITFASNLMLKYSRIRLESQLTRLIERTTTIIPTNTGVASDALTPPSPPTTSKNLL